MSDAKSKPHILMVGPDRSVHGGISGVVNGLYEAGIEDFVTLEYIGTMREGSRIGKLFVAIGAYLRFLCRLKRADAVHVHVASDSSMLRKLFFIRAAAHKTVIIHQHGGDLERWFETSSPRTRKRVADAFNTASRIITISPAYRDTIVRILQSEGYARDDIRIMPNAIDTAAFDAAKPKTPHSLLFLGRICEAKGIRELIGAVGILAETYPDITLTIGGIWEDAKLRDLVESEPHTHFAGWVTGDGKRRLLEESEIFVMPSYFEGQCVSILEAQASGCLVVASDVGGIPMMVQDGETGILVEPRSTQALAEGLKQALDPDLHAAHERMAAAARRHTEESFDIHKYLSELTDMYGTIIHE